MQEGRYIPAWRPNKITLLPLLPLDLTMYHHFISFLRAVQSREGLGWLVGNRGRIFIQCI